MSFLWVAVCSAHKCLSLTKSLKHELLGACCCPVYDSQASRRTFPSPGFELCKSTFKLLGGKCHCSCICRTRRGSIHFYKCNADALLVFHWVMCYILMCDKASAQSLVLSSVPRLFIKHLPTQTAGFVWPTEKLRVRQVHQMFSSLSETPAVQTDQ